MKVYCKDCKYRKTIRCELLQDKNGRILRTPSGFMLGDGNCKHYKSKWWKVWV